MPIALGLVQMGQLAIDSGAVALAALAVLHVLAGIGLGLWFRFGALLVAFAVVVVESLVGDFRFDLAPWFALMIGGIVLLQLGYACAARLNPQRWAERHSGPQRSFPASTPK